MGNHRHAARAVDGGDAVCQRRPFVAYRAGFAVAQVFGERLPLVFDVSVLMRNSATWVRLTISLFAASASAPSYAPPMPFFSSLAAMASRRFRRLCGHLPTGFAGFVLLVEIQTDNVYGTPAPRYRNFHAVNQAQTEPVGFGTRFGDAARVVVVGQRQQRAAVLMCEADDFGGGAYRRKRWNGSAGLSWGVMWW